MHYAARRVLEVKNCFCLLVFVIFLVMEHGFGGGFGK